MVIFHSYVSLPEGTLKLHQQTWASCLEKRNLDQQKPGRWTKTKQIGIEGYELGPIKLAIHSLLLFGILQDREFKVSKSKNHLGDQLI